MVRSSVRGTLTHTNSKRGKVNDTTSAYLCAWDSLANFAFEHFRQNAGRVASNDDSDGPDSYLQFTAARDGDFVVSVADHLENGGPDYTYRVEISPVSPRLELSTPNESLRRGTNVMAPAIPREIARRS